jgi:glycosyltransferase involved in cell wall biosynthesis
MTLSMTVENQSPIDLAEMLLSQLPDEAEVVREWPPGETPLLSVNCCAYNHEWFIAQTLHGMLIQRTTFPFEVLVHDDCSTDQTAQVIQLFAERYPAILKPVYQRKNQYSRGFRPARINRDRAQGRYIALCEGDDYWVDPHKLQRQVDFLESHPEFSICGHDAVVVDSRGERIRDAKYTGSQRDFSGEQMIADPIALMATNSYVYRVPREPYPRESTFVVNGDQFLVSFLGQFGGCKYLDDLEPSVYRIHDGGIWSTIEDERIRMEINANTWFWLYRYYSRIGKQREASRCRRLYLEGISRACSFSEGLFVTYQTLWRLPRKRVSAVIRNAIRSMTRRPHKDSR